MKRVSWQKVKLVLVMGAFMLSMLGCETTKAPDNATLAKQAFAAGDWQKAILKYTQAISSGRQEYEFYYNRGICYKELGRLKKAVESFTSAIQIRPNDNGRSAYQRGKIYLSLENYPSALQDADIILALNSENIEAIYIKGISLYHLKNYDDAVDYLAKAGKAMSSDSDESLQLRRFLGKALFKLKKPKNSQKIFMDYMQSKEALGLKVTDDDYYWAGKIADVNLQDALRNQLWSKLSRKYKKSKGIK